MNDKELDALFWDWSKWRRQENREIRRSGPKQPPCLLLNRLLPQACHIAEEEAYDDPKLVRLNAAIEAQLDERTKTILYAYYLHNMVDHRKIKQIAWKMKISRPQFYRILNRSRQQVYETYENYLFMQQNIQKKPYVAQEVTL